MGRKYKVRNNAGEGGLFKGIKSELGYKQKQPRITFIIIHSQNLFMNIDSKTLDEQEPTKCTSCKSFYGSQAHKGLCSSCFKKSQSEKNDIEVDNLRKESVDTQADAFLSLEEKLQQIELPKPQVKQQKEEIKPAAEEAPKQVDKKRCYNCKKKVGLLGIQCKCGFVHCNTHRLPEEHGCTFNHKKVANDRLKEALVKVYNGKIAQI